MRSQDPPGPASRSSTVRAQRAVQINMARPTLVPAAYPALVSEQYRALEDSTERQTEIPPAPPALSPGPFMSLADWEAVHQAELRRDAARWQSGPKVVDDR